MASGSIDGTVRVFDVGRPAALLVLEPLGTAAVTCLRWSPHRAGVLAVGCGACSGRSDTPQPCTEDGVLHVHDLQASPHDAVHRVGVGERVHVVVFHPTQPRVLVVACGAGAKSVHVPAWLGHTGVEKY